MSQMPQLRDILNDRPADAVDVEYNFGTLETHVAQELVNRDGSVAMTAPLNLSGPPTAPAHAASKSYVDAQVVPTGVIWQFAGSAAPTGWELCRGGEKSSTDPVYAALFGVIGYTYGQGTGANFLLPNFEGRVAAGASPITDPTNFALGKKAGSKDAILVAHAHGGLSHQHANPAHQHAIAAHQHNANHSHSGSIASAGLHQHRYDGVNYLLAQFGAGNLGTSAGGTFQPINMVSPFTNNQGEHSHALTIDGNNFDVSATALVTNNDGGSATDFRLGNTDSQGVAAANANLPPYTTINYIIKL